MRCVAQYYTYGSGHDVNIDSVLHMSGELSQPYAFGRMKTIESSNCYNIGAGMA